MPPIKKTSENNLHPNVAAPAWAAMSVLPPARRHYLDASPETQGPHRLPCRMPCQSRTAQPQSGAQRAPCTPFSLCLTPPRTAQAQAQAQAQRKRTDGDDSPAWPLPPQRRQRAKSSRWRPDTGGLFSQRANGAPTPVSHYSLHGHATVFVRRRCKENRGKSSAASACGRCFVHKRREDGAEGLTTLHTTPQFSPHTELCPSRAHTHTLSLPPFTVQSRELKSSCSHGGSPASPPPAVRVHSLR